MLMPLIASTVLSVLAGGQDMQAVRPEPDILSVHFTNGTIARVRVLGLEDGFANLREIVFGGSMEVRHQLEEFEPESAFRIELAVRNPSTFEEHFAMARRAGELGLPQQAGQHASAAMLHLEGDLQAESRSMALRTWLADSLEGWLRDAVGRRDLSSAIQYLKLLATRHPDLRTEEQLDGMAQLVEELERDAAARRRAERQARLDERTRADIERRLEPILEQVEAGDALYRKAIGMSAQMTRSANLAEQAIQSYREAWKESLALQKRHPGDQSLVIEIESIANHVHDHAILAALHASNLLVVRGNFVGAMEWVREILAMDPTHPEALELQRTITIAGAAASAGWWWGDGRMQ